MIFEISNSFLSALVVCPLVPAVLEVSLLLVTTSLLLESLELLSLSLVGSVNLAGHFLI